MSFDQDTRICAEFFSGLLEVYRNCGGDDVLIGSNYKESNRKKPFIRRKAGDAGAIYNERKTLITSGALVPLRIFDKIGPFRDDYFIDSVDHEFSLRARAHGYRLLISCRPLMEHRIGNFVEHRRNLRLLLSFHHSARRKYYIARNTVFTASRYFLREPAWGVRQGWRLLSDLASIILLEDDKARKIRAFLTGIGHGMRGKLGPIEEAWPNGKY